MRIQYISDIHLELLRRQQIEAFMARLAPVNAVDVLCLCGDIGNPFEPHYEKFLSKISEKFPKIFVIAGNHEYYKNRVEDVPSQMAKICAKFPNVTMLENQTEIYGGHKFIGSTLWSHISQPRYKINDTASIRGMTVEKYNEMHQQARLFIKRELEDSMATGRRTVVLTHHLPLFELTHRRYLVPTFQPYHQWFSANLADIIEPNKSVIAAWIYGHTHSRSTVDHQGVMYYTNPIGYEFENDPYEDVNMWMDL